MVVFLDESNSVRSISVTRQLGSIVLLILISKTAMACYTPALTDTVNFKNCQLVAQRGDGDGQYYLGYMYHYR